MSRLLMHFPDPRFPQDTNQEIAEVCQQFNQQITDHALTVEVYANTRFVRPDMHMHTHGQNPSPCATCATGETDTSRLLPAFSGEIVATDRATCEHIEQILTGMGFAIHHFPATSPVVATLNRPGFLIELAIRQEPGQAVSIR